MAKLKSFFEPESLRAFFMGNIYPAILCALVLIGSVTGLEYFVNFIVTALAVTALFVSRSVRPFIAPLCTYIFQISLEHSFVKITDQGIVASDYYYTGWRLPVSVTIVAVILFAFFFFFFKNKIYKRFTKKDTPLLMPIIAFASALILNGAFSGGWSPSGLWLGALHAFVFSFLFFYIYHGFSEDETTEELMKYMAYLAMLFALVILGELCDLYLTSDEIFRDGSIVKDRVFLGWGIWNLVGVCISMLIPMIFYGAMNNKYPWLYFAVATLALLGAVLTMSRNALIFASLSYAASAIIGCFYGKHKKGFRIITSIGILCVIAVGVVMFGKIRDLLGDYFSRGFDNNGRFELWGQGIDNFLDSPVFGRGFYGYGEYELAHGPLPKMAHNTLIELLSATGAVGFISYAWYRVRSLIPVFRRPSLMKTMAALSIAVILGASLLDNFVFNVYPMFFYVVLLALIHRASRKEELCDTEAANCGGEE